MNRNLSVGPSHCGMRCLKTLLFQTIIILKNAFFELYLFFIHLNTYHLPYRAETSNAKKAKLEEEEAWEKRSDDFLFKPEEGDIGE